MLMIIFNENPKIRQMWNSFYISYYAKRTFMFTLNQEPLPLPFDKERYFTFMACINIYSKWKFCVWQKTVCLQNYIMRDLMYTSKSHFICLWKENWKSK